MARLRSARSVKDIGKWLQSHGVSPGENRDFGFVHPVHTATSLHYQLHVKGNFPSDQQGNLALDINDRGIDDTWFKRLSRGQWKLWKPKSESETLKFLYAKFLKTARRRKWPLDEMFHNGFGYRIETGYGVNTPISGHDGHLHIGFTRFHFK